MPGHDMQHALFSSLPIRPLNLNAEIFKQLRLVIMGTSSLAAAKVCIGVV